MKNQPQETDKPSGEQLLSSAQVRQRLSIGKTTLYQWIDEGIFPQPIRLGTQITRWRAATVDAWIIAAETGGGAA